MLYPAHLDVLLQVFLIGALDDLRRRHLAVGTDTGVVRTATGAPPAAVSCCHEGTAIRRLHKGRSITV